MADKTASQRESWLVLQAQSGSHEALNELFKSVQEPLFRYIVSLVRDVRAAALARMIAANGILSSHSSVLRSLRLYSSSAFDVGGPIKSAAAFIVDLDGQLLFDRRARINDVGRAR